MDSNNFDFRPELPPLEELMANDGRLLVTMILKEMPYKEYLQTEHWKSVRKAALRRADYRCFICMTRKPLDVHHTPDGYEHRGEELDDHVVCLCREHHNVQHEILRHAMRARSHGQLGQFPNE